MKTATELNLTDQEYAALLSTREKLASGSIPKDEVGLRKSIPLTFNMAQYCHPRYQCGSAMCIGGFMKLEMMNIKPLENGFYNITQAREEAIADYVMDSKNPKTDPIYALFFPEDDKSFVYDYDDITVEQAVKAIDNFLETGYPDWVKIVEGELENA